RVSGPLPRASCPALTSGERDPGGVVTVAAGGDKERLGSGLTQFQGLSPHETGCGDLIVD
ncbi:MAG TPA: hypothetical protein VFQ19_08665, partial [Nocardioidaceae bacterium]|nr:hypothetical protein [Nocardioidaceae bacterium]